MGRGQRQQFILGVTAVTEAREYQARNRKSDVGEILNLL